MKSFTAIILTLAVTISVTQVPAADENTKVPAAIAEKGELIFSDDFERNELGADWQPLIPTFAVADGVMKGTQTRDDHGAVGRVYRPMEDIVVEFKFRFAGSPTFNVVFDDKNLKEYSHAGHVCRVAVTPTQIRLGDDKEGIMRNDIFKMRKDPAKKAEADKLLEGRTAVIKTPVDPETWHTMRIEIAGDEMRVSLDEKPVGFLKSPGLAHPTKESLHFTVTGSDMLFDEVRIWRAK